MAYGSLYGSLQRFSDSGTKYLLEGDLCNVILVPYVPDTT